MRATMAAKTRHTCRRVMQSNAYTSNTSLILRPHHQPQGNKRSPSTLHQDTIMGIFLGHELNERPQILVILQLVSRHSSLILQAINFHVDERLDIYHFE